MYSELFVVLLVVCIIAFNKMKNNRNSSVQTDNENKPQYKFKTIDLIPILLRECDNGNSQAIVDRAYIAYYKPELFSNPPSKQDIYNTFKDAFYKRNDLYSGWNTAIMNYYGEGTDQNIDEFYKIIKILIDLGFCDKDSNDRNIVAGYPQIKNLLNELRNYLKAYNISEIGIEINTPLIIKENFDKIEQYLDNEDIDLSEPALAELRKCLEVFVDLYKNSTTGEIKDSWDTLTLQDKITILSKNRIISQSDTSYIRGLISRSNKVHHANAGLSFTKNDIKSDLNRVKMIINSALIKIQNPSIKVDENMNKELRFQMDKIITKNIILLQPIYSLQRQSYGTAGDIVKDQYKTIQING